MGKFHLIVQTSRMSCSRLLLMHEHIRALFGIIHSLSRRDVFVLCLKCKINPFAVFSNLCKQLFDFSWTSCERWIWLLQHFCMQIFMMRASCDFVRSLFLGPCNCRNLAYLCYLPPLKTGDVILLLAHTYACCHRKSWIYRCLQTSISVLIYYTPCAQILPPKKNFPRLKISVTACKKTYND